MTTQLTHESSSSPESTESTRNRGVRIVLDPVQDGIGEGRIELVLKHERTGVRYSSIKAALTSSSDHVRRIVDANHLCTQRNQFFRQHPVTTTQIEDALAGLGLKQIEDRLPESGHEMSIIGIGIRIPLLGGGC
jgi:hypothetical protein